MAKKSKDNEDENDVPLALRYDRLAARVWDVVADLGSIPKPLHEDRSLRAAMKQLRNAERNLRDVAQDIRHFIARGESETAP